MAFRGQPLLSSRSMAGACGFSYCLIHLAHTHINWLNISLMHPVITEYGGYLTRQITAGKKGVYSGSLLAQANSHFIRAPVDSV